MTPLFAATTFPNTATEHVEQVIESMPTGHVVSILLLGGIFVTFVLALVWKAIDFRLTPLKDVPQTLIEIRLSLGKMWSHEQLNNYTDNRINLAIQEHEREYHKCTQQAGSPPQQ